MVRKAANMFSLERSRMTPSRDFSRRIADWLVLFAIVVAGCESRPKAPALRDAPVFHNKQEGLRLLVPEGWKQTAGGTLPPGKLEGNVLLARFRLPSSESGASLDILCFDDEKKTDLQEIHAGRSHGVERWQAAQPPESVEINHVAAQRFILSGTIGKQAMIKEVVSFRRKQRVYSFVGLFAESDNVAREEMRRATSSIVWEH